MIQLSIDSTPSPLPQMVTCLSLHQPYAGLVAAGLKDETRLFPWPEKARPYPAPLLICSTTRPACDLALEDVRDRAPVAYADECMRARGVALAVVDVIGCRELAETDLPRSWYLDPGGDRGRTRYLWTLANVQRVTPFPVKGMQGFMQRVPRAQVDEAMASWRSM